MTTSPATAPPAPISPDDVRVLMEMAASLRLGNDPASATIGYGPDLPAALTAAMLPTRPAPDVATTTS